MASQNWHEPSTGQSAEQKSNGVTDHSDLCPDAFQGQSMAGGNATTEKQNFGQQGGQGSYSESLELVANPNVHDFGDLGQVQTALGTPAGRDDSCVDTKINQSGEKGN